MASSDIQTFHLDKPVLFQSKGVDPIHFFEVHRQGSALPSLRHFVN